MATIDIKTKTKTNFYHCPFRANGETIQEISRWRQF